MFLLVCTRAKVSEEGRLRGKRRATLGEHMIEEDDDIQDYKKPWVGLTEEELCEIVGLSTNDSDWNVFKVQEWLRKVEEKLRSKNT
jgi:hypothetical protein